LDLVFPAGAVGGYPTGDAQEKAVSTSYARKLASDSATALQVQSHCNCNLECGGRGEVRAGDTAFAEPQQQWRGDAGGSAYIA